MPNWIISGVSVADATSKGYTIISTTSGPNGNYGQLTPTYKVGSYTDVDFCIAYRTTTPTAIQSSFTATGSVGGIYNAQRMPYRDVGTEADLITVCFPQFSTVQGDASSTNRIMVYQDVGDAGFSNNDYLSYDIQGYTPIITSLNNFINNMANIGIPVFFNDNLSVTP